MAHYEIDEVKWRVTRCSAPASRSNSADEIAELEAALRTDDPEELQRIHDKWAQRPTIEHRDPPLPDCLDCRRPMRFGYPLHCEKHPYVEDSADEAGGEVASTSASEAADGHAW